MYADVDRINQVVPGILSASDPTHSLSFSQTGGPALDENENQVLSASLAIVLPITVSVLILITMLYFRSPIAPLFTFAGIAIALVLGLGGTVLIGTLVTHVDSTALTLVETFVLGVGTDYSVFIVARYREELINGRAPKEAVVTSLTWAGQSVRDERLHRDHRDARPRLFRCRAAEPVGVGPLPGDLPHGRPVVDPRSRHPDARGPADLLAEHARSVRASRGTGARAHREGTDLLLPSGTANSATTQSHRRGHPPGLDPPRSRGPSGAPLLRFLSAASRGPARHRRGSISSINTSAGGLRSLRSPW